MKIPEFSSVINVNKINTKFYKPEYIVNDELEKFKPYYERLEQDKKEELLQDFIRIVNQGTFIDGTDILYMNNKTKTGINIKVDFYSEMLKRMEFIKLMIEKPKIYNALIADKATIFHGTNSRALDSILQNGIQSMSEIKKNELKLTTGEEFSRVDNKSRNFISLTQDYETAKHYSEMSNSNDNKDSIDDFGIILCLAQDYLEHLKIVYINSDCDEIPIEGVIPVEAIKTILAPEDKVSYLQNKLQGAKIKVISDDIVKEIKSPPKKYDLTDLRDLTNTRTLSSIKETIYNLKERIKGMIKIETEDIEDKDIR